MAADADVLLNPAADVLPSAVVVAVVVAVGANLPAAANKPKRLVVF